MEARRERVDRAVSRLENGFEIAVAVLQQVATKQETPPYARRGGRPRADRRGLQGGGAA